MKVRLSPGARRYVVSETRYLAERRPPAAHQFGSRLRELKQKLMQFPRLGQAVEDLPFPGILRFVMGDYVIDYELRPNEIVILAIRHGRQLPAGIAIDDDFDYEDL